MVQNNQLCRKIRALNEVNGRLRGIPDKLNWLESRSIPAVDVAPRKNKTKWKITRLAGHDYYRNHLDE